MHYVNLKDLTYSSRWPAGPLIAKLHSGNWATVVQSDICVEASQSPLEWPAAFTQIHVEPNWKVLISLFSLLQSNTISPQDWESTLRLWGLRRPEEWSRVISWLAHEDSRIQDWVTVKKLTPKELLPITLMSEKSDFRYKTYLSWLSNTSVSKSEATQIIEWLYDMRGSYNEIELSPSTRWMEKLKKLRFPIQSENDQKATDTLKKLPWPSGVNANWIRTGDESSLQIQVSCISKQDLIRKIESLQKIANSLDTVFTSEKSR